MLWKWDHISLYDVPKGGSIFAISGQIEHDAQICNVSKWMLHVSNLGIKSMFGGSDLLLFSFSPSVCVCVCVGRVLPSALQL